MNAAATPHARGLPPVRERDWTAVATLITRLREWAGGCRPIHCAVKDGLLGCGVDRLSHRLGRARARVERRDRLVDRPTELGRGRLVEVQLDELGLRPALED